jgi:hypothetical protein
MIIFSIGPIFHDPCIQNPSINIIHVLRCIKKGDYFPGRVFWVVFFSFYISAIILPMSARVYSLARVGVFSFAWRARWAELDHKTLERVRIRVVRQVERGARPKYLARVLGFARSTVFGWMARYRERGLGVLKARIIPGRPQKLSGPQLSQIYTLVVGNDPSAVL